MCFSVLKLLYLKIDGGTKRSRFFYQIHKKYGISFIKLITTILASNKLKKLCKSTKSLEKYIDIALNFSYSLFKGSPYTIRLSSLQNKVELIDFIVKVAKFHPKIIFEIGTHLGGTFFLFSRFSSQNALLISMDLPTWNLDSGYGRLRTFFYRSFKTNHQKMELFATDSHKSSSLQKIKDCLNGREIDLLFIDGDHTYEGVKKDFEMYSPFVKNDGLIAFHDIVVHDPKENCEVNKFWKELKDQFEYLEIVENWDQKHWGIGIINYKKAKKIN